MIATTRSVVSVSEPTLYVAFELSKNEWKLAMTSGFGVAPWLRTVASGDWRGIEGVVAQGRRRFGLPAGSVTVSCYEAGRDGFWIHRALLARGWRNRVVDSASLEVNRRARRTKTDRIDALKLVAMLVRRCCGEPRVWSEVHVPTVDAEATRHVSRERAALVGEQTRVVNQMRSWLATYGSVLPRRGAAGWWRTVRDWAGTSLPDAVQQRLARAAARLSLVRDQIAELDTQQQAAVRTAGADAALGQLVQLKGVAVTSASVLIDEGLVWRAFRNRRQVGGLLGFAPTPYDSGETHRDQGIGRGNRRLQTIGVQLAWQWVRWQPDSALTQWYRTRFGRGKRARRIGIVALARKLVIALWRYATTGVAPAGAIRRAA